MALLSKRERNGGFRNAAEDGGTRDGLSAATGSLFLAIEIPDFEAQVLSAWDPALRGQDFVVVDQDPENHKTHVRACSPSARALGLRAGMPYAAVRRRWRQVAARFRNPAWETALREELAAICYRHTPDYDVREGGAALLDLAGTPALREAERIAASASGYGAAREQGGPREGRHRDGPRGAGPSRDQTLTGPRFVAFPVPFLPTAEAVRTSGFGGAVILARRLQQEVRSQTGLTDVALGLAATRLMARVMARQAHPAGLRVCPPGREAEWLAPLEPSALPGLSPGCRERIRRYAFTSVGQIRELGREALAARFGPEGDKLYTLACGLDLARVPARRGGIRVETVLAEDVNDDDVLARKVRLTADKLAFRLRAAGAAASRLTVGIRYSDQRTARKTLAVAPATDGYETLADLSLRAFRGLFQRRVALRAIALAVERPETEKGQLDLFEDLADRRARALGDALTRIRDRSGFAAIVRAGA